MASDWIRWNNTAKVFQGTLDFGNTWNTLIIDAAGVSGGGGSGGPHAATHYAAGADPVDVKQLSGFPGGTTTFLRADKVFATAPQGPQGIQGIQGPPGNTGSTGPAGPAGPTGQGEEWYIDGAFPGQPDFYPQAVVGDTYLRITTGDVYDKMAEPQVWQLKGNIKGPQGIQGPIGNTGPTGPASTVPGPTGPQGIQGPQGIKGDTGNTGSTGSQGPQGIQGIPGPIGPEGPEGPIGPEGTGIEVKGTVPNFGALPPTGNTDGDAWITSDTGHMWVWDDTTNAWVDAGKIVGPVGPAGPQGIQGPIGPIGPQGTQGIQGVKGDTGNTGSQGPIGNTGPEGPQGIKGDTGSQGPQGNTGATGSQGIQGIQGIQGVPGEKWFTGAGAPSGSLSGSIVGDWYLDSANGDYYEKTGASAWTLRGNLKGATGSQGSTGNTGSQGIQGVPGTPGEVWFTGSGAPAGATGIVGDWYIDSATGDYYEKTGASAWTLRGNLKGPAGTGVVDAQYWVSTAHATLTAERNLGALASGYVKSTVSTGVSTPSTVASIPAGDGGTGVTTGLTVLDATNLTTGTVPAGRLTAANLPAHASRHNAGGADAMTIDSVPGTGSLRTLGTGANQAAPGNDARFTAAPQAHATTHKSGGSDVIKLDELAAPTDITTLNATTSVHGLMQKYPGGTTNFLRADGTFAAPPGGSAAHQATHQIGGGDTLLNAAWVNQANTFTQIQTIRHGYPILEFYEEDGAANQKRFQISEWNSNFYITGVNDSGVEQGIPISATRDGDVTVGRNLTAVGSSGNVACKNQANTFTQDQTISKASSKLTIIDSSSSVDNRRFSFHTEGTNNLSIRAETDAGAFQHTFLQLSHVDGSVVTSNNLHVYGSGGNVACKDQANIFTQRQAILAGSGTGYHVAPVEIQVAEPRIAFHWPGINALQIGMNSSGQIRTYDNPGTGYAEFVASTITAVGNLRATGSVGSDTNIWRSNLHPEGGIYPGNMTAPTGVQSSWCFNGHSSYGIYCNTGFCTAGGIWTTTHAIIGTTLSCGSTFTLPANVWHNSSDGYNRIYYGASAHTYMKSPSIIVFRTNNTDSDATYIDGNGGITSAWGFHCRPGVYGAVGANWFNFEYTGAVQCWVDASHIGNIAFTSDARLKRDFKPLENSLDKILKMRPGTFYYLPVKENTEADPDLHLGWLAQELLPVAPELVHNTGMKTPLTPDGALRVDYLEMIPMLVGAIQELARRK